MRTKVKPDSTVKVIISLGPETVVVPNVEQRTIREAEIILENEGFIIGEHQYVNSEYPSDTVIGQSLEENTEVPKNSEIWLTISLGPRKSSNRRKLCRPETRCGKADDRGG